MSIRNIAGEEVTLSRVNVLAWLKLPSGLGELTNGQYFLDHVMPWLYYRPSIPIVITSEPWFKEMLGVLSTLDPQVSAGRMGITPNGGVFRARLRLVRAALLKPYERNIPLCERIRTP